MGDPAKSTEKIGYLSLPGEIRNQIMTLVLLPGDIYLPNGPPAVWDHFEPFPGTQPQVGSADIKSADEQLLDASMCYDRILRRETSIMLYHRRLSELFGESFLAKSSTEAFKNPVPGIQLLATNRRIYNEGHHIFWTRNMFYLPQGPLAHAQNRFDNILPDHKPLIKRIGVKFSFLDLTKDVVAAIEVHSKSFSFPSSNKQGIDDLIAKQVAELCVKALAHIWAAKLAWTWKWKDLEEMKLQVLNEHIYMFDGRDFDVLLKGIGHVNGETEWYERHYIQHSWTLRLQNVFDNLLIDSEIKIYCILQQIGWTGFKRWLNGDDIYTTPWGNREDLQ